MDDDVVLIERAPTPAEYARLRSELGLAPLVATYSMP